MRTGSIAMLSLVLAAIAPAAVQAKSYSGDGYRYKHRAVTGRSVGRRVSAGTGSSCLTSDARNLLGRIQARFGHVELVSTCRPGARIAGTRVPSKHASGRAIDFRIPGHKGEVVQWLIANHHSGGVMTYNDMDHIHVDVGARFVALNRPSGRT